MKNVLVIIVAISSFLCSCNRFCEKIIQGEITDRFSGEGIANVMVLAEGADSNDGFGKQFFIHDPVITDENGAFELITTEKVVVWNYNLEHEEYVGDNLFNAGSIFDVSCGTAFAEITMRGIAYVDLEIIDDLMINGSKASWYTEYPTEEIAGELSLMEISRIPVLANEDFEIEVSIYDLLDEFVKEEIITVNLMKGEVKFVQITI